MRHVPKSIAVVTGANRGLGHEVARQLAMRGVHVVMTARDAAAGRAAADDLAWEGLDVTFHQLDVEDRKSIRELRAFLEERHGHVDILINNAGAHPKNDGSALAVSADTMSRAFTTNCVGALQVSQELVELLAASSSGRIVNVSTILACPAHMEYFAGTYFAYRISKAALNAATVALAVELRERGIKVNAVHPGWLKTAMGGPNAPDSVEDGADAVVDIALGAAATVSGKFFVQKALAPW